MSEGQVEVLVEKMSLGTGCLRRNGVQYDMFSADVVSESIPLDF